MANLEETITQINTNLDAVDDLSQLSDWFYSLASHFAFISTQVAKIKRERASVELRIKAQILEAEGKYTEKDIERRYYATEDGKYMAYGLEMQKGISKLLQAIKYKQEMLKS